MAHMADFADEPLAGAQEAIADKGGKGKDPAKEGASGTRKGKKVMVIRR
jgi:hypothetical protein